PLPPPLSLMFEANDRLNNCYQLQSLLGETATGHQTWLAVELPSQPIERFFLQQVRRKLPIILFDPPNLERYIIKLLAFSPQLQWEEVKLFEREAQVLQTLNHSRIPRYRDYFETESPRDNSLLWFALVQDYINGSSLQELINYNVSFTEKQLKNFAKQILDVLIYLHNLNPPILHRDIKPSNLILGQDNQLYLIDFGAVQAKASLTGVTFTIVGTGGYTPLEQFWGKAVPASDLYAVGATLIHLATGIAPANLPQQNSRLQFSDRLSVSSGFIQWLETLTELDPQDRFQSAEEALTELNSLSFPSLKFFQSQANIAQNETIDTAIKLQKDEQSLLINLPNQMTLLPSFSWFNSLPIKLKISLGMITIAATGGMGAFLQHNQPELLSIMGILLMLIMGIKLFKVNQRQSLFLDQEIVKISRKISLIPYKVDKERLSNIVGFFIHEEDNNEYKISINTKKKIYFLPSVSKSESHWLLKEIEQWLKKQANSD
ncbi:MAG: serine/threonine protein kinase, partial [Microcystaceae cyanobacterium]